MKTLSVRQPWAWAIFNGKDIENRDWATGFRGRFLIHASAGLTKREYVDAAEWIEDQTGLKVPPMEELVRGAVLGSVYLHDCVANSESRWFQGRFGFVLIDRVEFEKPIPAKGKLGFWDFSIPA